MPLDEEFDPDIILPQSDFRKALRYAKEYFFWMLSGFKYRSQEEVNEIFDNNCDKCTYFDRWGPEEGPDKCTEGECGICGCPVNKRIDTDNKVAYKTTKCAHPERFW